MDKMIFRFFGESLGEEKQITDYSESLRRRATCYKPFVEDMRSGLYLGRAGMDCLLNVKVMGEGLIVESQTYFNLPGGHIVSRGTTTIQPLLDRRTPMTHLTASRSKYGSNDIVLTDGIYEHLKANVRLSGMINMSRMDQKILDFDCIFVIVPL